MTALSVFGLPPFTKPAQGAPYGHCGAVAGRPDRFSD